MIISININTSDGQIINGVFANLLQYYNFLVFLSKRVGCSVEDSDFYIATSQRTCFVVIISMSKSSVEPRRRLTYLSGSRNVNNTDV